MVATTNEANFLVDQLSGNFAAEGKRTCRDCLRSKAVPSQRVVDVIEKQEGALLSEAILVGAHSIVQQRLAGLPNADRSVTALAHMDMVATAIRFIQLLLYLPQLSVSKQRQPLVNHQSSNMSLKEPSSPLSPDRLDQLLHTLLENLVQSTAGLLSSYHVESASLSSGMDEDDLDDPMTSDASSTQSDARPVACFAFLSILRLHQFCKRRQQWMIPLYKGICDLASVAKKVNASLPPSLIEDAIRTMTKLLEEGTLVVTNHAAARWKSSTTSTLPFTSSMLTLDHHTFFAKFLSFLVSRSATLLSLLPFGKYGPSSRYRGKNAPMTALFKILTTLRGLSPAIRLMNCQSIEDSSPDAEESSFLQNYDGMATKVEKQLIRIVLVASTSRNKVGGDEDCQTSRTAPQHIRSDLLLPLLEMKLSKRKRSTLVSPEDSTSIQDLVRHGRVLGQALLLQRILHKVSCDSTFASLSLEDADCLLKSCECYHSVVLPQCFGLLAAGMCGSSQKSQNRNANEGAVSSMETLLAASLPCLTALLLRIEKSLMSFDSGRRSQFHRLLIRWMAPSKEAGEVGAARQEAFHEATLHPISQEFVLSQIYMYIMTSEKMTIPPPLITLMVKLLFDARTGTALRWNISIILLRLQASLRPPAWVTALCALVENEFADLWRDFSTKHNGKTLTKKKRKRRESDAGPHAFQIYNEKDVEVIGHVLATVSASTSPLLREAMLTFVREDVLKLIGKKRVAVQIKSISLLLWYMHGGMFRSDSAVTSPSKMILVMERIFEHVLVQRTTPATDQNLMSNFPLIVASLSLCRALCINYATTESTFPIDGVCHVLSVCTSDPFLRPSSKGHIGGAEQTRLLRYRLLFLGMDLLGSMGTVVLDSCPDQVLETIREIFLRLFSVHDLNIIGPALSALVNFGKSVTPAHAHMLPTFLPKTRVQFFQARSQGMIWKNSCHFEIDTSLDSFEQLGEQLETIIQRRSLEKSIFLAIESCKIALGSFFLQMPTRNGRQALVIFPPGEQSLEDIRQMYELRDEDELPQVQTLKRVVLPGTIADEGCNCILSKFKLV